MPKQGQDSKMPVVIDGISLDDVDVLRFAFCQQNTSDARVLKEEIWDRENPSESTVERDGDMLLVNWDKDETYLFKRNSVFYMDIQIESENAPECYFPITELFMSGSLFKEESDDGDDEA